MSSRRAMTLGFEEMKRLGGMLVLKEWIRGFVSGSGFITSVLVKLVLPEY